MGGLVGVYECIKAFSETDFTEDLKKIQIPTLLIHGDDDQIVPFADSAPLSSKLLKQSRLEVVKGGPHALPSTHKDRINELLLAFAKS